MRLWTAEDSAVPCHGCTTLPVMCDILVMRLFWVVQGADSGEEAARVPGMVPNYYDMAVLHCP